MSALEEQVRKLVEEVVDRLAASPASASAGASSAKAASVSPASTSPANAGAASASPARANAADGRTVAIGADHGGFELKEHLRAFLSSRGFRVIDCGTFSKDPVDYPDIAVAAARKVASGEAWRGIMLDGAGIGSCMAANKIKGVRAALCYNEKTVINSRAHNNANLLTLGAPFHSPAEAETLAELWLCTEFEGGRHEKRVGKIDALDR